MQYKAAILTASDKGSAGQREDLSGPELERLLSEMGFFIVWQIITVVQTFFAYGTAYRLTKEGGDNGVALFGWFFVLSLASLVPGLGIYLWFRYKGTDR
jgi:hypothetical protein